MMDIPKRIIELREASGLNQSALSRKAKMPQSTLSYIESGESSPNIIQLEKICGALGIELKELFSETFPELPLSIRELIGSAQCLEPDQVQLLNEFIKSITERVTTEDDRLLVAESPNIYEPIAADGNPDPMKDLPPESIKQIESLKLKRLIKYKKK